MTIGNKLFGYAYDQIGNRQQASKNADNQTYTANNLNQYSEINNGSVLTPKFDADGNLTNDGRLAYTWDAENRLSSASGNSVSAVYKYDYMSRRYQKVSGSVTNTFTYDGWNLVREISSSGITNVYNWGLDLSGSMQGAGGIGGLLSVTRNGVTYYPVADGNGNITDYVDASGVVVAHREFDAYGNTLVATGAMVNDFHFWFSSKYLDADTGLYYYGYRYYDPVTGRWLSKDPIEEEGGVNLYIFIRNNSLFFMDARGLTGQVVGIDSNGNAIYADPYGPQTPGVIGPDGQQGLYDTPIMPSMPFDVVRSILTRPQSLLDITPEYDDHLWYALNRPKSIRAAETYIRSEIAKQNKQICAGSGLQPFNDFVVTPLNLPLPPNTVGGSEQSLGDPLQTINERVFWIGYFSFRLSDFRSQKDANGQIKYTADMLIIDKLGAEDQYMENENSLTRLLIRIPVGPSREYISARWQIKGEIRCCE